MKSATVKDAADLLNGLLAEDQKAISDLFRVARVTTTSEVVANHPTVQVSVLPREPVALDATRSTPALAPQTYRVGLLGLLNGILGNGERLAIQVDEDFYDDPDKLIERFIAYSDYPDTEV